MTKLARYLKPFVVSMLTVDNDNLKITNYDHLKFTKNGKF